MKFCGALFAIAGQAQEQSKANPKIIPMGRIEQSAQALAIYTDSCQQRSRRLANSRRGLDTQATTLHS